LERRVRRYERCLLRLANEPTAGPGWIHEIKHDGFRILSELSAGRVKLITRKRLRPRPAFPTGSTAIAALPSRSCVVDGVSIACDGSGTCTGTAQNTIDNKIETIEHSVSTLTMPPKLLG
jgi:ATP-dependent DNA ligase